MKVKTTRFRDLEVNEKDIITFPDSLIGSESSKLKTFFIVDPGDETLILWLQAIEGPSVACPIIEPKIFKPNYQVGLTPTDLSSLNIQSLSDASVYSILTIPAKIEEMTANLQAPIVINNKTKQARQIILQNSKLEIRYPMYKEFKAYVSRCMTDGRGPKREDGEYQNPPSAASRKELRSLNVK